MNSIYLQQEIDWIEERGGQLYGYEMKWSKPNAKAPTGWTNAYPDAHFKVVHPGKFTIKGIYSAPKSTAGSPYPVLNNFDKIPPAFLHVGQGFKGRDGPVIFFPDQEAGVVFDDS